MSRRLKTTSSTAVKIKRPATTQDSGNDNTAQPGWIAHSAVSETNTAISGYSGPLAASSSATAASDNLALTAATVVTAAIAPSTLAAAKVHTDAAIITGNGPETGRPVMTGNAPSGGRAIIVGNAGGMTNSTKVTNNTSVNALAVNTAESQYLAATGITLNGAGMKIGILSDSFNLNGGEANDIADGDLPAASQIHILKEGASGADEGRALAELIHSIAPAAQIYFYTGTDSEADMAAGINTLTADGMNVIIDDVTYTDEPFFEDTGVITKAVEASIAAGISYFTSAGNSSDNFYEAAFRPMTFALPGIGTETVHNIANGSPYEAVTLATAATLDFTMEWTQPWGSNQYDIGLGLYSYSASTKAYTLIESFATNTLNGNPINTQYANVNVTAGTYYFAFYESASNTVNGAPVTPGQFKIIFWPSSQVVITGPGAQTGSGTSVGHELAPAVNTVGAVNVAETPSEGVATPVVEPYSSVGNGVTYLNAAGTLLTNPIDDLTPNFDATDGSPTSVFDPFNGTSASAASGAAVGLLVMQADTKLTPVEVTYLLMRSAIASNSSLDGGAGLIQADVAVADALDVKNNPVWTAQGSSTLWNTAANWSDDTVPASGSAVTIVDGVGMLEGAYSVNFNVAAANLSSLTVDGKKYISALPDLIIAAGDALSTAALNLGIGTIDAAGSLIDTGSLVTGSGTGMIKVEGTGRVTMVGPDSAAVIYYTSPGGIVDFSSGSTATVTTGLDGVLVAHFLPGDVLDFSGVAIANVAAVDVTGNIVTLVNGSDNALARVEVLGTFGQLSFSKDSAGGTEITAQASGTNVVGSTNYQKVDVAGLNGPQAITAGGASSGLLVITNTDAVGYTSGALANVSLSVPGGYSKFVITAPGTETVQGNGDSNVLATFGANSKVNFNTEGGSGSIAATGFGDTLVLSGSSWSVTGAATGGVSVNSNAATAIIAVSGQGNAGGNANGADTTPSNVVGLASANSTVISGGSNDLIETFSGNAVVSVNNSANILINGGSDTVYATASSTAVKAFFNLNGGKLDFVNNSSAGATVSGAVPGANGGSTTAFGGAGGGVYVGGNAGNNSLVGGAGGVVLVGAGTNNFLSVQGAGSYAYNIMEANAGSTTMVAGATTNDNEFIGGTGTDYMSAAGAGYQAFYVGVQGSEYMTGSTVKGSENEFIFNQNSTGDGSDIITNFRVGTDHIDINFNGSTSGVSIAGLAALGGARAGTLIYLSNNTTIQLYGVTLTAAKSALAAGSAVHI